MITVCADASALVDFDGHRAADHIAGSQVFGIRRIPLHESLAFGIRQITAFSACTFGDQTARTVDAGRMKLNEFHILCRQARTHGHRIPIAGAGVR